MVRISLTSDEEYYNNPIHGFKVILDDNGRNIHTALIREGCDGSPSCAMEIYVAKSHDYLGEPGLNIHASGEELELLYRAVKAVRKAWKSGS